MHCRQVADGTKQNAGTVDRVLADKSRPVEDLCGRATSA